MRKGLTKCPGCGKATSVKVEVCAICYLEKCPQPIVHTTEICVACRDKELKLYRFPPRGGDNVGDWD